MTHISHFCRRASLLALLLAVCSAGATGLPDTGQDTCYDGTAMVACGVANSGDAATYPRQDGRYGRDAAAAAGALSKTGGGAKGFDYSKIANNGSTLAAGAALGSASSEWACTKDNTTGLTWEVKTTSGLRSNASNYTWYSSNDATNAGNAGTANGGTCSGGSGCDTETFVADVNAAALCSYSDWRMPTQRELLTLVLLDGSSPSIDPSYFPNTQESNFWSATSYASQPPGAWTVFFGDGATIALLKLSTPYVRLVRGGQF